MPQNTEKIDDGIIRMAEESKAQFRQLLDTRGNPENMVKVEGFAPTNLGDSLPYKLGNTAALNNVFEGLKSIPSYTEFVKLEDVQNLLFKLLADL